ncbi:uncharacterized protein BDW70DRAFT_28956 [Aspergillus foveolatus]|uniref:uncharacterized protein n=1 Tax=Aspergillus foveolatus TaxID=210207 RepID=UPI003CCDC7E2
MRPMRPWMEEIITIHNHHGKICPSRAWKQKFPCRRSDPLRIRIRLIISQLESVRACSSKGGSNEVTGRFSLLYYHIDTENDDYCILLYMRLILLLIAAIISSYNGTLLRVYTCFCYSAPHPPFLSSSTPLRHPLSGNLGPFIYGLLPYRPFLDFGLLSIPSSHHH